MPEAVLPIAISLEHQSTYLPNEARDLFLRQVTVRDLERDADRDVEWIAPLRRALHVLKGTVSRDYVDLNRPRNALVDENGRQGAIYTHTLHGQPLYPDGHRISEKEREDRLKKYWDPFYGSLKTELMDPKVRLCARVHHFPHRAPPLIDPNRAFRPHMVLSNRGEMETGEKESASPIDGTPPACHPEVFRFMLRRLRELSPKDWDIRGNDPFRGGYTTEFSADPKLLQEKFKVTPSFLGTVQLETRVELFREDSPEGYPWVVRGQDAVILRDRYTQLIEETLETFKQVEPWF